MNQSTCMSELDKHITLENFERLYSEYKPRFIIIARSYIRNNMAAEDIVTDSFLYFWENKDKLNITTTIQAYILGSVKHGCLEWLRNQKNRLKIQQQIHTTAYRSIKAKITVLESTNPEASFTAEIKSIIESQINKMPEPMRKSSFTTASRARLTKKSPKLQESMCATSQPISNGLWPSCESH